MFSRFNINDYSSVFILTDSNVAPLWLDSVKREIGREAKAIIVEPGEQHKNLQTVQKVWDELLKQNADRHSLLVNLGGGVISDMGGFAASCFKRGIGFINVPTTLLSMVDASVGGKTGVDYGGFKNQIGVFCNSVGVVREHLFLSSLPRREVLSGMAEMLKCGFVADGQLLNVDESNFISYIERSVAVKENVVSEDPLEQGHRRILNFGHTVGHAVESHFLQSCHPLLHGEAVAVGMWCALWMSERVCGLGEDVRRSFENKLQFLLSETRIFADDFAVDSIMDFLSADKKNVCGSPRFVLLEGVGKPVVDVAVDSMMVAEALNRVKGLICK